MSGRLSDWRDALIRNLVTRARFFCDGAPARKLKGVLFSAVVIALLWAILLNAHQGFPHALGLQAEPLLNRRVSTYFSQMPGPWLVTMVNLWRSDRANASLLTWAQPLPPRFPVVTFGRANLSTSFSDVVVHSTYLLVWPHWVRTLVAMQLTQRTYPSLAYLLKADDDSFVYRDRLFFKLQDAVSHAKGADIPWHDPLKEPLIIGKLWGEPAVDALYPLGGASYILTRAAVEVFLREAYARCVVPMNLVTSVGAMKDTSPCGGGSCTNWTHASDWNDGARQVLDPASLLAAEEVVMFRDMNEDAFIGACAKRLSIPVVSLWNLMQEYKNTSDPAVYCNDSIVSYHYMSSQETFALSQRTGHLGKAAQLQRSCSAALEQDRGKTFMA